MRDENANAEIYSTIGTFTIVFTIECLIAIRLLIGILKKNIIKITKHIIIQHLPFANINI